MCFTGATNDDIAINFPDLNVGIRAVRSWQNTINEMLNGSGDEVGAEKPTWFSQKPHMIYIDIATNKRDKVHESAGAEIVEELSELTTQILAHNNLIGPIFKGEPVDDGIVVEDKYAEIVKPGGDVSIPASYFPMLRDEQILQVHGQIFRAKFIEWIITFLTLGFYYFWSIRPKRYNRTAFIITTHRISEIIINHRSGQVPSHGSNYTFGCRNFFPRSIHQHGFITRSKNRVSGGVLTDFGPISLTFDMFGRRDVFEKFLNFFSFFQLNNKKSHCYPMEQPPSAINLTGVENKVIRLEKGEFVIGRTQGDNNWRPLPVCSTVCQVGRCPRPCYPWLPWILCCSLRPKRQVSSIIVTNRCVYFMSAITNYTCTYFADDKSFSIAYAPLEDFVGISTKFDIKGKEWCARRMWQWVCCCNFIRNCFPISKQEFIIEGSVSTGAHIHVKGGPRAFNEKDSKRDAMNEFDMAVARAQAAIFQAGLEEASEGKV